MTAVTRDADKCAGQTFKKQTKTMISFMLELNDQTKNLHIF